MARFITHDGFELNKDQSDRIFTTIKCVDCSCIEKLFVKSASVANADGFLINKFSQGGWDVGRNRNGDVCPTCSHPARQRPQKVCSGTPSEAQKPRQPQAPGSWEQAERQLFGGSDQRKEKPSISVATRVEMLEKRVAELEARYLRR